MIWPLKRRHREDDVIDDVEYALQEAWLSRHGLTRFVRFILTILIAFVSVTGFIQTKERDRCEQSKAFVGLYAQFLEQQVEFRKEANKKLGPNDPLRPTAEAALKNYQTQLKLLHDSGDINCNDEYPILPLIGI